MIGRTIGPYLILDKLGEGGMGVVYKARDTRLGRDVAVKVLPPAFARDPDRLARFEREARAVAAINHPNILAVHDIGSAELADTEHGTVRAAYLITELLDGETLRAHLAQGPVPPRKSIDIAIQVARGLAAAHDRGIVHRDLKPENIVVGRDGHVKILDFGLAKHTAATAGASDQQTMAATDAGTVMGTVGYMSPEQVRGEAVDARTDLFALGAVLHELLTGQRAFAHATAAETMTAILREDPDLSTSPPAVARVVRHALEKHPNDRFQSARDFAFALQSLIDTTGSGAAAAPATATRRPTRWRELAGWTAAVVMAVTAAALWFWPRDASTASPSPVIFAPVLPWRDGVLLSPSVAPDGTRVAYILQGAAHGPGGDSVVIRQLDTLEARALNGTLGVRAGSVFWSPDGRSLGFFAGGKLKTIEIASGKIEEIASAPSGYGGTWGTDGTILFNPDERAPIFRVGAQGGQPTPATALDVTRGDEAHRWPRFLPDGRRFVFMPWRSGTVLREIQLGSLDGPGSKTLFESESAPVVAGTYFVYVRDVPSRLMAQAFNPRTLELEGRPVPVIDDDSVEFSWFNGNPMLSASPGALVYTTGKFRRSQLTWFSRTGRSVGTVGDPDVYYGPAISLDGARLAVEKRDPDRGASDLWTVDLARGAFSRLTSTPGFESSATWSPDGRIAFSSDQGDAAKLLVKNASGVGPEEVLVDRRSFPMHWSHDGRYLAHVVDGGATRADVWIYDVERRTTAPLIESGFVERMARFSPDGKWIAYVSDESRDAQVYVRSFPGGATKIQISSSGGEQPEWRRDGRELFYLAPDGTLMAAELQQNGAGLHVGGAQPLFRTNVDVTRTIRNNYAATADGQRFLVMSPLVDPGASPLVGVLNWAVALPRR